MISQPNPLAELFHNIAPPIQKPVPQPKPQPQPKTDDRLPIDVMASIQKLYLPPPPMNVKPSGQGLDPTPGWGGKGR